MESLFIPSIITDIENLPSRMRGEGSRADEYEAYTTTTRIAILKDEEFNQVVEHNTKRMSGPEANVISLFNEGEGAWIVIRESALLSPLLITFQIIEKQ